MIELGHFGKIVGMVEAKAVIDIGDFAALISDEPGVVVGVGILFLDVLVRNIFINVESGA